jgi:hypothetical protein
MNINPRKYFTEQLWFIKRRYYCKKNQIIWSHLITFFPLDSAQHYEVKTVH